MICSFWLLKLFESVHRHLKVRRPGLTIRQENQKVNGVVNGQNAPDSSDVKRDEICFGSCHLVLGIDRSTCRMSACPMDVYLWGKTTGCYRMLQDYNGVHWTTMDYKSLQHLFWSCHLSAQCRHRKSFFRRCHRTSNSFQFIPTLTNGQKRFPTWNMMKHDETLNSKRNCHQSPSDFAMYPHRHTGWWSRRRRQRKWPKSKQAAKRSSDCSNGAKW